MNKYKKLLDDNYQKKVFFPFSDRYIQEYYGYNYYDISYFLRLSLFYGEDIYITAANVWQSELTYLLYKEAYNLIDNNFSAGMVHLSTRKIANEYHVFDNYFVERSEESEHFLTLPSIYALLDSQIYDKRNVAKELDNSVLPIERVGVSVSKLLSKNIMNMFKKNSIYINEDMSLYLQSNLLSRTAIADYILGLPYHYKDIINLIERSNFAYYLANAESNRASMLYPRGKYDVILCGNGITIEFYKMCLEAGLSKDKVNRISFDTINQARRVGVLEVLHMLFRFLVNTKESDKIRCMIYKSINTVVDFIRCFNKNVNVGKSIKFSETNFECDIVKSFTFNINKAIAEGERMRTKDTGISAAVIIEELNKRFSLEELKNISTSIFDGYDQFPHSSRTELSRELCLACKRTDQMNQLLSECLKRNSSFSILPENMMVPVSLTDWKGGNSVSGDYISDTEYEKIIESRSRFQSVSFLEKGLEIKDRICMIKALHGTNRVRATGFLLKNNFILTNRHVFLNKDVVKNAQAVFGYDECKNSVIRTVEFDDTKVYISQRYDLALAKLRCDEEDIGGNVIIYVGNPQNCIDDIIPIIQHPNGMPKQICIGHNSLKYVDDERIQYLTDTLPGSSGSPVFNSNWELIGLHSKGGNICEPRTGSMYFRNEGVNIRLIEKFIQDETPMDVKELL